MGFLEDLRAPLRLSAVSAKAGDEGPFALYYIGK